MKKIFNEPEMIKIPQGFSIIGDIDFEDATPLKQIYIHYNFSIAKYPITIKDYLFFLLETNYDYPQYLKRNKKLNHNYPIVEVSYEDAINYTKWLSQKTKKSYKLPNEEEWEYVARAGSNTQWCFGDDESILKDYAWYLNNSNTTIHSVGEKKPNNWGIHDMYGNIYEWCDNYYTDNYHTKISSKTEKVIRGGCWKHSALTTSSAFRDAQFINRKNDLIGFRVIRMEE